MAHFHKRLIKIAGAVVLLTAFTVGSMYAQQLPNRQKDARQHRNGKLWTWVTNFGQFGTDQNHGALFPGTDNQRHRYINRGGLFLGGIVPADGKVRNPIGHMDTLVSEGPSMWSVTDFREMLPFYADDRSNIEVRSTISSSEFYHPDAVSEEDFIAIYTDIFTAETGLTDAKHKRALGLEIIEKSYQFSFSYAEDIVFFDVEIKNIGENIIKQFYIGFFGDNDISQSGVSIPNPPDGGQRDDASGFMVRNSSGTVVNTAWVSEPDGDNGSMPSVVGVRVLRPTTGRVSFNWWMSDSDVGTSADWGPRTPDIATGILDPNDPYGSPEEDEDKYLLLVNGSFDPPQFNFETGEYLADIPAGADPNDNSRFSIAFGPLGTPTGNTFPTIRGGEPETEFRPGDSVFFTFAVIGGEGDPAISNALQTTDPAAFIDLGINSATAQEMFDNTGYDTDGDGYAGDDLDGDGIIDTGDGVPDFRGPPPPPAPPLTATAGDRKVVLDWSKADPSSAGYDPNDLSLPLNFKDTFVPDDPNTPENESQDFEGFVVLRSATGLISDYQTLAVFDIADNEFGNNTGLRFDYTDHIPNGATYFYAVASFDRGVPSIGLESLRSSPLLNAIKVTAGAPLNTDLKNEVWVEPNPYIEQSGFEPSTTDILQLEHQRVLDFVNLPAKCTIRIFTVDGDLVQTLQKDDATTSRFRWDMLTRSIQAITSGIYLYSVIDDSGNKFVGKFVVIK